MLLHVELLLLLLLLLLLPLPLLMLLLLLLLRLLLLLPSDPVTFAIFYAILQTTNPALLPPMLLQMPRTS
jgi:hypothetical protein